jgi:hypothetical protein
MNHPYSEKSKAPKGKLAMPAVVGVGDLVYLHLDGNKLRARDRYLVVSIDNEWCYIRKFTGNQLRSTSYKVKRSECYMVLDQSPVLQSHAPGYSMDDELSEDEDLKATSKVPPSLPPEIPPPPKPPHIPQEISLPAQYDMCINMPEYDTDMQSSDTGQITEPVSHGDLQQPEGSDSTELPRRSSRTRKPPKHLDDYVV